MAKTLTNTNAETRFTLNWDADTYYWSALIQDANFPDDVTNEVYDDNVGFYSDPRRDLTTQELGSGSGSLSNFFDQLKSEAETRETVIAGQRIVNGRVSFTINWLSNTTYAVKIRFFNYPAKRNDPENGKCWPLEADPVVAIPSGYVLDATDLGDEATEGHIAWFIKTKVLDPIKTAENIV